MDVPPTADLGSLVPELVRRCREDASLDDLALRVKELATFSAEPSTWTEESDPPPVMQLAAICDDLLARRIPKHLAAEALEGWVKSTQIDQERYQLGSMLGRGGTAEIRSAWDRHLERDVALKILSRPGKKRSERFVGEARLTAALEHPGIVPVHDLGVTSDGRPYFAMKQVRGRSLGQVIAAGRAGSLAERLGVFSKICDAVAFAHAQGLLHRDLKPENVMIGAFGEVLVLDWGLAQRSGEGKAGRIAGTPAYMAPEQAARTGDRLDRRTDIYGLGAVLYELLTGRAPFSGPTDEVLEQVQQGAFERPREVADVPRELEAVILKCMARDPAARFDAVSDLQAEITRYLDGTPLRFVPYTRTQRIMKWVWRHQAPVFATLATATVAGLALAGAAALYSHDLAEQRRVAIAELAYAQLAVGDTHLERGDVNQARQSYLRAAAGLAEAGEDGVHAEVALAQVDDLVPPPLHARLHDEHVYDVAISPDGRSSVSCGRQTAVLASLPGLEQVAKLDLPAGTRLCSVAFDGERPLALALTDERVVVSDVHTGVVVDEQDWPGLQTRRVALRPDAGLILFQRTSEAIVYRLGGEGPVLTRPGVARISPDGRRVAFAPSHPEKGAIVIVDLETQEVAELGEETVLSFHWADDDALLLSDGVRIERATIRDPRIFGRTVPPHRGSGVSGSVAWFAGWDMVLRGIDTRTLADVFTLPLMGVRELIPTLDVHPESGRVVRASAEGELWLHPAVGRPPAPVPLPGEMNYGVDVSPDGRLALVAGSGAGVTLVELMTRRVLRTWPVPEQGCRTARFSPDGRRAAVAVRDGTVRILDLTEPEPIRVLVPGDERVLTTVWLDDDHLLSAGTSGEIVRWNLETSEVEARVRAHDTHMWDLALSADGRRLLTGGYMPPHTSLRLWDAQTLEPLGQVDEKGPHKFRLALDETGQLAAAATHDGQVLVWAPQTGAVRRIASDVGPTLGLSHVPGTRWMLATGYDGDLTLLDLDAPDERAEIRRWTISTQPGLATAATPDGRWALQAGGTSALTVVPLRRTSSALGTSSDVRELADRLESSRVWHEVISLLEGREHLHPHAYARAALALGHDDDARRILSIHPPEPGEEAWAALVVAALEAAAGGTE